MAGVDEAGRGPLAGPVPQLSKPGGAVGRPNVGESHFCSTKMKVVAAAFAVLSPDPEVRIVDWNIISLEFVNSEF